MVKVKDYGVPQNRPRVLLVGIRKDMLDMSELVDPKADPDDAVKCGFLPKATREFPDLVDLLSDLIDDEVSEICKVGASKRAHLCQPSTLRHQGQKFRNGFG